MTRRFLLMAALLVLALVALPAALAQDATQEATDEAAAASEVPVTFIEITGLAAERDAEISSLAWYGDTLILITENPFIYADGVASGMFFALEKEDILEYLDSDAPEPLEPYAVPIFGPDIADAVSGFEVAFDGFEAAVFVDAPNAFADDQVFLTVEADTISEEDESMRGYVVWGTVLPGLSGISLRLDEYVALPTQTEFNNMSYETLLVAGDQVVAMYEVNGAQANPEPVAATVNLATGETATVPVENIEFRVTDATDMDDNGVFWVTNYFFPGETFLATDDDPIAAQYGTGASQLEFGGYERLVAMQLGEDGITIVDQAPVQLQQVEGSSGRNWEGIARLDDRGVLVVTDRFPVTLLGFVGLE